MPDVIDRDLDIGDLDRLLVAHATEAIVVTDSDVGAAGGPRILRVNPAFERSRGYKADEAVGHGLGLIYPADVLADAVTQMRALCAQPQPAELELHARNKDGRRVWVADRVFPMLAPNGKPSGFVRVGRDVTRRRRAEQELAAAQRLLASIFGAVDQGLAVIDDSGMFAMANLEFAARLGVNLTEILGRKFAPFLQEADSDAAERLSQAARQTKRAQSMPVQLVGRDGSTPHADLAPVAIDPREEHYYTVVTVAQKIPVPIGVAGKEAGNTDFGPAVRAALDNSDKNPATVVAGKLKLVGLDDVRKALGDKWPAFAERTFSAAEAILKRFLGPHDAFSRTKDDGFLVCFAELGEEEASFKAQVLRREIRDRLIGESAELVETKVESFVAEIPVPTEEADEEVDFADEVERRLKTDRERREKSLRQSFWTEITPGRIRLEKVRTNTGQAAPLLIARLPSQLESGLEALHPNGESELHFEAGILLLSSVAERVLLDKQSSNPELILVPVHIATLLERKSREAWLKVARGVDEVGKTRLILEIFGLSKDIGQARLTDIVTRCAPLFRALAVEMPDCDTAILTDLPAPARILTLPVRRAFAGPTLTPAFGRLARAASVRMRQLLIKDVTKPAQAKILANAGVGLIAGSDSV